MEPAGYVIRRDSSFCKFGGFCEGAKRILRGDEGLRMIKRPMVRVILSLVS